MDQAQATLTFFVELPAHALAQLFGDGSVATKLAQMGAGVALAMLDLSDERARAIALLNAAGVPVTAWLLLDRMHGYWLTADNAEPALLRYGEIRAWLERHGLAVVAVGLDIESPHEDAAALFRDGLRALHALLGRRRSEAQLLAAQACYRELVAAIHSDGLRAETYQMPILVDERQSAATLLQRTLGVVDVRADREVLMLYRSLLPPPLDSALVDSYGPAAQAIGVGITGGGVAFVLDAVGARLLDLGRLLTDLRRARRYVQDLYVFSLEGCIAAGYFDQLCSADLEIQIPASRHVPKLGLARGLLGAALRVHKALWD